MHKIKTAGGRVLYIAQGANDVKTAMQEAVKSRAYLGGADLRGADLGGADLRGADLGGADLGGAYLGGADLRGADLGGAYLGGADLGGADLGGADLRGADLGGAYLGGADLGGAYLGGADLRGADLRGAYLRGADLGGAYLRGADLRGADLGKDVWQKVATALKVSIQAMNDGGRHWIKGSLTRMLEDGSDAYCSIGSVEKHADGTTRAAALWLLESVCGGGIATFNDFEGTTWKDVQAVFAVAIMHAERFAKTQP